MPAPHKGRDPHRRRLPQRNHRRTIAFVEDRMHHPGAFRASRRRPVEGGKRRRRPAEGIDHSETRRKPMSRSARHRLMPAGRRVGRRRRPPVRTGPFRPIESGAHSGSSPPTSGQARVRPSPPMGAGGRGRVSLPGPGRIAERIAYGSGDPDRQPTAHVRRHPRPQPQPRAPDPNRCPRPRHDPEACCAAALPGDGSPSPHPRPVHRTHHATGRQIDPLHERQRRPG